MKQSQAPAAPSAPAAPATPPSRLARTQALLAAADEAQRLIRAEIATLQGRQRQATRELAELDRDTGQDVGERINRRMTLQAELTAVGAMMSTVDKRHREADLKQMRARDEVKEVERQADRLRQRIDEQQGRIRRQQRVIEEAESTVSGHRNGLANLERQVVTWTAELQQTVGADVAAQG